MEGKRNSHGSLPAKLSSLAFPGRCALQKHGINVWTEPFRLFSRTKTSRKSLICSYLADIKEKLTERRSSFTREQVQISARTTVFAGLCYLGMKQTHFPSGEMPALIPASSPAQVGWMQWDGHRSGETTMSRSSKGQWGSLYFKGQGLRVMLLATPSPPPARLRAFSTSSGNETKT